MAHDEWRYQGVVLPRGAVVQGSLDADQLADLSARAAARRGCTARGHVTRSASDEAVLQEISAWVNSEFQHPCFGAITFSDRVADRLKIYSPKRALDVVEHDLKTAIPIRGSSGYLGKFCLQSEWHRTGRNIPHLHTVFEGIGNADNLCTDFWRFCHVRYGSSWFQEIEHLDAGVLYAFKDVFKEAVGPKGSDFRFRLKRSRRLGRCS